MAKLLQIRTDVAGDVRRHWLKGAIDEHAEAAFVAALTPASPIEVWNLRDVTSINSYGVKIWCMLLRETKSARRIRYEECASVVVEAMVMVSGLTKGVEVESVLLPLECRKCTEEVMVPLRVRDELSKAHEICRGRTCHRCGDELRLGIDVEELVGFNAGNAA